MNLTLVKSFLWLSAIAAFGVLGWSLYEYKQKDGEWLSPSVTVSQQEEILYAIPAPEPEVDDLADYTRVKGVFHELDWTGKPPPPPPVEVASTETVAKVTIKPVADLLTVLYLQVDTRHPDKSKALVRYLDAQLAQAIEGEETELNEGDVLPDPHAHWSVESIAAEGVTFAYAGAEDEEPREPELLTPPSPLDSGIVYVSADGELIERDSGSIPTSDEPVMYSWPDKTMELGPNRYRIGADDALAIGENYLDILSSEVRHRNYRNPRTGRWEGVEIMSVSPGSIAAQHGVKSGDVVKSINGHPVNSAQEAIQYAKANADVYDVWTVVIANSGKERTVTYETPK